MKNIFPPFAKLIAVAACALTLGSCSRAEYAMLPKGGSYHGVTRVATPVPAASVATAATPAPAAEAVVAPAMAPEATVAAAVPAAQPVAKAPQAAAVTAATVGTVATVAAAPKLNFLQRVALNKVTRKMDKLIQKSGAVRQHDNTASTTRSSGISGNLRIGIILLLVGLLVGIFNGLIGTIIAVIGLIFIILWLLDQL